MVITDPDRHLYFNSDLHAGKALGTTLKRLLFNTCIRSSGLPVGSHGIVGRRAQKSGHQLAASPYWITRAGI